MKMWRFIWISLYLGLRVDFLATAKEFSNCPPGCYCDEQKTELIPDGFGLRINCHPTISGSLNFSLLPSNTIVLDLAKYGLKTLPRDAFLSAPNLQQLDLQNNGISSIDPKTFRTLPNLKVLDLSYNNIEIITKPMFANLRKLERLKVNSNKIETIENGSFDDLFSLVKIEMVDNKLSCDCHLEWFVEWISTRQNILSNPAKTKCALPIHMVDVPIRKVLKEALKCPENLNRRLSSTITLEPSEHQVVFEEDSIKLSCKVQISATQKVFWLMKGRPLEQSEGDNIQITTNLLPGDIVEAIVNIKNIKAHLSGDWTCIVGPQDDAILKGTSSWSAAPFQRSVNVLVITSETKLCAPTITDTARGNYRWGVAVGGHTVQQSCQSDRQQQLPRGFGFVYYLCKENGEWGPSVNATQCAYTSAVTETLHKFASMNTSFDTVTLMESAKHFLNYTGNPELFQDPLDVVFFSKAVQNYLPYLRRNGDVGHYMLKMLANTLAIDPSLVARAQRHDQAAKQLLDLMDNVTSTIPTFEHHGDNIVLQGQPIKPIHFEGITCTWYITASPDSQKSRKIFHCTQGNKTVSSQGKIVLGSITLPISLIHQLTANGLVLTTSLTNLQLMFAAFSNASLFPDNVESTDYEPVSNPVIGSHFVGMPIFNLTETVHISLRYPEYLDSLDAFSLIQPIWWSSAGNGGYGSWTPDYCNFISAKSSIAVFSCSRLGYYSYRISRDAAILKAGTRTTFRSHHPVTYVSSVLSSGVLILSILVYISCNISIRMSRKLKHALPNVWASMACLCFLFMAGINQTQHQVICRSIGITTHYLTLSTLLWLVVCTHIVYQKVTKQRQQTLRRAVGDEQPRQKLRRPLTRFYLFGYGIGLIIVATTASINLEYYTTSKHCFLKLAPFLGSVVLPAAVLLSLILGFALSAYCVLSTAPSHVTEQMDVDLFRSGRPGADRENGSFLSVSTINNPDEERSSKATLHSQGLLIIMFLLTWSMAALAVTQSSPFEQKFPVEDLFSIFFSLSSTTLSFFVFGYFCVLRRDVRRCWRQPICLTRSRRPFANDYDDQTEETTNLVNIFPNPNLMGHATGGSDGKFNFGNNYSPNTFSDNLPPPHNYNFGQNGLPSGGIDQSAAPGQHRGNWGVVSHSGKDGSIARKNSEDGSSDRVSLNNINHLRRGYVAPVNSGCVSEADYALLPHSTKYSTNQSANLLSSQQSTTSNQGNFFQFHPHTSSPAGQSLPQFIDLSPMVPSQLSKDANEPYGIIALDSRLENDYTESSTIKVGHPFQMSSLEFKPLIVPQRGVSKASLPHLMPSNKSASMPRRHPQYQLRHRSKRSPLNATSDQEADDARSKHSVGSSTCYSKKSNQRRRRKPPNRRKHRTKEEPFYNNINRNQEESGEENYMGDDDQFDSIERHRLPLHSSAPEFSEDQLSDPLLMSEDDSKDLLNTSAQIQQFMQADLMKRETSV